MSDQHDQQAPGPVAATGRRADVEGRDSLVWTRTFRASVEDVWAAVTEPARLERWIGTWTGDPASGGVSFRMTAEGEDVEEELFTILACDPPHRLVVETRVEGEEGTWLLSLRLAEEAGVTTLTFAQAVPDAPTAGSVGPGWEYYLDRLVAAERGAAVGEVAFGDYHPALAQHYTALFA